MRKVKLIIPLLLMLFVSIGNVWGAEATYTFTAKNWTATDAGGSAANWNSVTASSGFTNGQGIQITGGNSICGYSPVSFSNITKIIVKYCTNSKAGAGSIKLYYSATKSDLTTAGGGTQIGSTFTVTKPSSGGTTLKEATWSGLGNLTGYVQISASATANSVYIHSIFMVPLSIINRIFFDSINK